MMLVGLRGHEEANTLILRDDITGMPGRDMQAEFRNWIAGVEKAPYVLIGASSHGFCMLTG